MSDGRTVRSSDEQRKRPGFNSVQCISEEDLQTVFKSQTMSWEIQEKLINYKLTASKSWRWTKRPLEDSSIVVEETKLFFNNFCFKKTRHSNEAFLPFFILLWYLDNFKMSFFGKMGLINVTFKRFLLCSTHGINKELTTHSWWICKEKK